ncbi:uncharacterized protein si:zfos-464b6.2 [Cololabis saira]|uniref:uncharacterized protein si:zfos-464b6.2 n=1 Tax=Cololabis saira TaxID=129043 RepID=UPI002AD446C3|nr:uncharacterized protein si:zfos-464b6.2 [Cololabis saira]
MLEPRQRELSIPAMDSKHQQRPAPKRLKKWVFIFILPTLLLIWSYSGGDDQESEVSLTVLPKKNQYQPRTMHFRINTVSPTPQNGAEPTATKDQKAAFIRVSNTKTLLISAYLEHRTEEKQVRVIAVVHRSELVAYHCLLCCENQNHSSEGLSDIHSDHFNFPYGTADIMFPLPPGCSAPSLIAVASSAAALEDEHNRRFLEIRNQKADTNYFPYNFTVCISAMFDFTNVLQLVQSLEMLQLLGVNRVVVYKTNCSSETQRILDYYARKGLVEVILWPASKFLNVSRGWLYSDSPGDLHYFGQIPALNDCLYRYMYRSRYLALHDIDELILPQTVNSWLELLPLLEEKYGDDKCYMFENNQFPNNVERPPPSPAQGLPPKDRWKNVSGVNILAHLYQEPITPEHQYEKFKIIVNPRAVFRTSVHGVLSSLDGCVWVDRDIARMYHTRAPLQTLLTADQLVYDSRLLDYGGRLVAAVDAALKENGLL